MVIEIAVGWRCETKKTLLGFWKSPNNIGIRKSVEPHQGTYSHDLVA